jgi:hypothetical protein
MLPHCLHPHAFHIHSSLKGNSIRFSALHFMHKKLLTNCCFVFVFVASCNTDPGSIRKLIVYLCRKHCDAGNLRRQPIGSTLFPGQRCMTRMCNLLLRKFLFCRWSAYLMSEQRLASVSRFPSCQPVRRSRVSSSSSLTPLPTHQSSR